MTRDVFICEGVRTPIGRFGGALAKLRTDDLAAAPIKALMATSAEGRLGQARRGRLWLRQPGGRGQPQCRAHGAPARGPALIRPPGSTVNRLCASGLDAVGARGARHSRRRSRFHDRRRRRIDVARALRHGQGRAGLPALGRDLRHDDRLALRQSEDAGEIRHRFHARDRRERRRDSSRFRAPIRTSSRLRSQQRTAKAQAERLLRRRDRRRSRCRAGAAAPVSVAKDEHPRADTTLEQLAQAQAHRAQGRRGDGRQRLGRQ